MNYDLASKQDRRFESRPRVLVIDDSPLFQTVVSDALGAEGCDVIVAMDGREGIAHLERAAFDLIVTDFDMPNADGIEVLRASKQHAAEIPVILLTTHKEPEIMLRAVREGAFDYVFKEHTLEPLQHAVKRALQHRRLVQHNQELIEELKTINASLDAQVHLRTEELERSNFALQQTIEELIRSRKETGYILQNIRQVIFTIGSDLRVRREHSRFAATLFERETLAGQLLVDVLFPDATSREERHDLESWCHLVFRNAGISWEHASQLVRSDYVLRTASGAVRELKVQFEPIREEGKLVRVMVLAEDVTETRALQRDLTREKHQAEESVDHLAEIARLNPQVAETFFRESLSIIERCRELLRQGLHDAMVARREIDRLFRDMHTIKGNALSFGLIRMASKATWVEDALAQLRSAEPLELAQWVREALDRIDAMAQLFQRIMQMAAKILGGYWAIDEEGLQFDMAPRRVEVDGDKMAALIEWLYQDDLDLARDDVKDRLRAQLLALTQIPLRRIYRQLPQLVRETADALGKSVGEIELLGGDVMIDAAMSGRVVDTLVQLVRNAVVHGIESPEERRRNSKAVAGTIRVEARQELSSVVIDVSDDGRGIDTESVIEKAIALGLDVDTERSTNELAHQLIFCAGLTTASTATNDAGRGVGLDLVHSAMQQIGGQVAVRSQPYRGTTFRLTLPRNTKVQTRHTHVGIAARTRA